MAHDAPLAQVNSVTRAAAGTVDEYVGACREANGPACSIAPSSRRHRRREHKKNTNAASAPRISYFLVALDRSKSRSERCRSTSLPSLFLVPRFHVGALARVTLLKIVRHRPRRSEMLIALHFLPMP